MSMSKVHHHHHHHARAHALWGGVVDSPQGSERAEARRDRSNDAATQPSLAAEAPAPRGNPLVGALMKALQGLVATPAAGGTTGTSPAPTEPGVTAPATPAPATGLDGTGELREAAIAFANELFGALRSAGREHDDRGRHRGHGHDGHPGHHNGWGRGGRRDDDAGRFEGLVGRLQALARTLGSPREELVSPAPISSPAPDGSGAGTSNLPTATPSTGAEALPAAATVPGTLPVAPTSTQAANGRIGINLTITVQLDLGQAGADTAPQADQPSPLLAAFQQLMDRLNPDQTGTASTPNDTAARLKTFLLDMATALSAGGQGNAGLQPPVGGLVNLSA
jgi:hypothetical protein